MSFRDIVVISFAEIRALFVQSLSDAACPHLAWS